LIGEDDFTAALRTFIQRWSGRHPLPHDLFATIEAVTGQDLQWFIRPWFFEFGVVDLAIAEVSHEEGKYRIVIERKGRYPAPIHLRLTFLDGSTESLFRTAAVWKNGESLCTIEYPGPQTIVKAELPDESLLDADTTNNTYSVP
jgi:aminopeptidase N